MSVIRLRSGEVCHRCGSSTDLPHGEYHDCVAAIGRDVTNLLNRTRELNERRRKIIELQAGQIERRAQGVTARLDRLRDAPRQRKHSA